jgi:prevent-host-death family protein
MRTVGAFEAKTHFSQLLTEVERKGDSILIQRRGAGVAVLSPFEKDSTRKGLERTQRVLKAFHDIRQAAAALPSKDRASAKRLTEDGRKR